MKPYIDVRGAWPMYVKGMIVIVLEGASRDITVANAKIYIAVYDLK